MPTRNNLKYTFGLAIAVFASDIKPEVKEYHFSPLVQREEITLPVSEVMKLYFDCDQRFYNSGRFRYIRTGEELENTVKKRRDLEEKLTRYYNEQIALSQTTFHPIDTTIARHDPLNGIGWFENSFNNPRPRTRTRIERHKAIDIFAPLNSLIYSPVNGIVVSSADDWTGEWDRKKGFQYKSGGLGELSGNGILLFSPSDKSYYFLIHMNKVFVEAGDILYGGQLIGTVGRTGNAISPYSKTHLHIAFKMPGNACGTEGTLESTNLFRTLAEERMQTIYRPVNVDEALY